MHIKSRQKNNVKYTYWWFHVIQLVFCMFSIFVCITEGDKLFLLPLLYFILYLIVFILLKIKLNFVALMVFSITCLRYVVLPLLYYTNNGTIGKITYIRYTLKYTNQVILIMVLELIAIIFAYVVSYKKYRTDDLQDNIFSRNNHYNATVGKSFGIFSFILVIVGIVIVIRNPLLIRGINDPKISASIIKNSIMAIYQVVIIIFALLIIELIYFSKLKENNKCALTIILYTPFIYLTSFMATSVSRNSFIINSLILLLLIFKLYRKYFIRSLIVIGVFGIVYFFWITYIKSGNHQISTNMFYSVYKSFVNYPMFNAYFAGPTNIESGYLMYKRQGEFINILYLFKDMFSNVPFVSKYFYNQNTLIMFNKFLSNGLAYDQIIPISTQSSLYFGLIFSGLLSFAATYFSNKCFYSLFSERNITLYYVRAYTTIVLCMAPILSINSISMLLSLRVLPLVIIYIINKRVTLRKSNEE